MCSGEARFSYNGRPVPTNTSGDVHQIRNGSTATVVIRKRDFNNFVNFEEKCGGIYHHLFLSNGEQCIVCVQILNTVISTYAMLDIILVYM